MKETKLYLKDEYGREFDGIGVVPMSELSKDQLEGGVVTAQNNFIHQQNMVYGRPVTDFIPKAVGIAPIEDITDSYFISGSYLEFQMDAQLGSSIGMWELHCNKEQIDSVWRKILNAVKNNIFHKVEVTGVDPTGGMTYQAIRIYSISAPEFWRKTYHYLIEVLEIEQEIIRGYKFQLENIGLEPGTIQLLKDRYYIDCKDTEFSCFKVRLVDEYEKSRNRFFGGLRRSKMILALESFKVVNMDEARGTAKKYCGLFTKSRSQKIIDQMDAEKTKCQNSHNRR